MYEQLAWDRLPDSGTAGSWTRHLSSRKPTPPGHTVLYASYSHAHNLWGMRHRSWRISQCCINVCCCCVSDFCAFWNSGEFVGFMSLLFRICKTNCPVLEKEREQNEHFERLNSRQRYNTVVVDALRSWTTIKPLMKMQLRILKFCVRSSLYRHGNGPTVLKYTVGLRGDVGLGLSTCYNTRRRLWTFQISINFSNFNDLCVWWTVYELDHIHRRSEQLFLPAATIHLLTAVTLGVAYDEGGVTWFVVVGSRLGAAAAA